MADRAFPAIPLTPPPRPTPVERVVRTVPLSAIREVLSVSLHDVINRPCQRRLLVDFYRVSRWIENENWLRHQLAEPDREP